MATLFTWYPLHVFVYTFACGSCKVAFIKMIEKKLVQEAVQILRNINEKYYGDSSKKKPLLEDEKESIVFLQVTLKKIPECESVKMIKVPLPHSLLKDSDEVCLITGDLDKRNHKADIEPDIRHYKEFLKQHNINCISQVITLRQLRTDYKPYEAKQKLLGAYSVFLADKKIAECLPRVLGRHFFRKRKFPIQIDMKSSKLKGVVEKALSTKVFHVTGHGNSCCSEVAHLEMNDSEIVENIEVVTEILSKQLPGQLSNINGVYIKTSKSKAIPIYMSYENPNGIQFEELENETSEEKNANQEELEESEKEAEVVVSDCDSHEVVKDNKKSKAKKEKIELKIALSYSNIEEPEKETKKPKAMKKKGAKAEVNEENNLKRKSIKSKSTNIGEGKNIVEKPNHDFKKIKKEKLSKVKHNTRGNTQKEANEKKNLKRKRIKSDSTNIDEEENIVKIPNQAFKKIKTEKLSEIKHNTRENAAKGKKKKRNPLRHKF